MPLPHLPDEILINILSRLALPATTATTIRPSRESTVNCLTLVSCCGSARRLHQLAEPLLYRLIWYPTAEFLVTITQRPELGRHIRFLDVSAWHRYSDPENKGRSPSEETTLSIAGFKGVVSVQYSSSVVDQQLRKMIDSRRLEDLLRLYCHPHERAEDHLI